MLIDFESSELNELQAEVNALRLENEELKVEVRILRELQGKDCEC